MKKLFLISCFVFLTSCGALRLTPAGCGSKGVWGNIPETVEEQRASELTFTQEYYVWNTDQDIKLKKFLSERNFECSSIKEIRVEMKSTFFVKRELKLFIKI